MPFEDRSLPEGSVLAAKKRAAKKVEPKRTFWKSRLSRAGRWSTLTKKNKSDLAVTILIYRFDLTSTKHRFISISHILMVLFERAFPLFSQLSGPRPVPPLLPCQKSDLQFESSAGRWELERYGTTVGFFEDFMPWMGCLRLPAMAMAVVESLMKPVGS